MSLTDFSDNFRYNVGPDVFLQIVIANNTEDCFSADQGWGQFCNDGLYFLTYGTTKSTETAPGSFGFILFQQSFECAYDN